MHGAATEDHGHALALLMSRNAEHQIQPNSQADLSMPVDCQTLHKDIFVYVRLLPSPDLIIAAETLPAT